MGVALGPAVGVAVGAAVGLNVLYPKIASVLKWVTASTTKLIGDVFIAATAACTMVVLTLSGMKIMVTDVTPPELAISAVPPTNLAVRNASVYELLMAVNTSAIALTARNSNVPCADSDKLV